MAAQKMNTQNFKEKIFDFENDSDWNFSGPLPVIIDFYADWCAPCKMLEPALHELSEEFANSINIYKVNIDEEKDLVNLFGITSVPTILFVPIAGDPFMEKGALPKYILKEMIIEQLLLNNSSLPDDN